MFGYVCPPLTLLPQADCARFQRIYCGLCHVLGGRYGAAARLLLNYDLTYLAILLSGPAESPEAQSRCIVSPVRRRTYVQSGAALETAADLSVILAYWQLCDGVADSRSGKRLAYRAGTYALHGAYRKAARRRPQFDRRVREQLAQLAALERTRHPSLDAPADTFAQLLSGAADEEPDPLRRRVLRELLYHLGRWIYLIDSADDLEEDAVSGNYNPVALRYGVSSGRLTGAGRAAFAQTLDHSIHRVTSAYELLDFGCWSAILETTFYAGLFQIGKAVLDGTFQKQKKLKRSQAHEESL